MSIFHSGKGEEKDDHKFVNERLLEVAIPSSPPGDRKTIQLEDCLAEYFENKIEVRRYLERRSTLSSMKSNDYGSYSKGGTMHIESVEVDLDSGPSTPMTHSSSLNSPLRMRTSSIIQHRFVPDPFDQKTNSEDTLVKRPSNRSRKGSLRKEVMMPAWQFFSLIRKTASSLARRH